MSWYDYSGDGSFRDGTDRFEGDDSSISSNTYKELGEYNHAQMKGANEDLELILHNLVVSRVEYDGMERTLWVGRTQIDLGRLISATNPVGRTITMSVVGIDRRLFKRVWSKKHMQYIYLPIPLRDVKIG